MPGDLRVSLGLTPLKPYKVGEPDGPVEFKPVAKKPRSIYLIGSLKNPIVGEVASVLRKLGHDVFDDWRSPGPDADDYLRDYYRARGFNYRQIMESPSARLAFNYDKEHLKRCDLAIMVMPAGKSGHLELGTVIGSGKPGYILFDSEPERVDIMHGFATDIFLNMEEMVEHFSK